MEVSLMEDETVRMKEVHDYRCHQNNALEIEKQVAENESKDWKTKCEKLVKAIRKLHELGAFKDGTLELDESVKLGMELAGIKKTETCKKVYEDALSMKGLADHQSPGSPYIATPDNDYILSRNRDGEPSRRRVNKMLSSEDDCHKSIEVVDLCDDKTEERSEKESADALDALEEKSSGENYEDEDVEATSTCLSGRKRKRVSTNDDDDDSHEPVSEKSDAILEDESDPEAMSRLRRDKKPKTIRTYRMLYSVFVGWIC